MPEKILIFGLDIKKAFLRTVFLRKKSDAKLKTLAFLGSWINFLG